ncbi:hypothetical protein H310_07786 [Aphanomyces invadans]|uniref:Uncharacterized protein n=1 Tax=Aphanomyces invadans TaxID=157072 RepID=A0A024U281_9STRA|nr:hypothetical protein H310_07786 [Aphanomyces invadans]ETV99727.1 hypothetical protein H310_07786 [Aphanomyces invadans]|eukprot:XP_008871503.1 hypothetical protein H310_07786 [Aphanomyces invadans]
MRRACQRCVEGSSKSFSGSFSRSAVRHMLECFLADDGVHAPSRVRWTVLFARLALSRLAGIVQPLTELRRPLLRWRSFWSKSTWNHASVEAACPSRHLLVVVEDTSAVSCPIDESPRHCWQSLHEHHGQRQPQSAHVCITKCLRWSAFPEATGTEKVVRSALLCFLRSPPRV